MNDDSDKERSNDGRGQPQEPHAQDKGEQKKHPRRSGRFLWGVGAVVLLAIIVVLIYHLLIGRYHVSTKDAYVNGDLIRLAPQVSGTVIEIAADETQYVEHGQLLVRLDPHDTDVSLAQAKANLAQTVRDVVQLFDAVTQAQAAVAAQEAQLKLGHQTLGRDRGLVGVHGVSQQDIEHDEQGVRSADAGLKQAQAQLASAQAAIAGTQPETHPRVLLAEASLRSAWLASARMQVRAPVSGYIVRRTVQLGQQVNPATDMLAMVPLDSVWIDANFKETELAKLRIGQPVTVTADIYGSHAFHGRVLGLTGGTGAALAVLPPENATGNWIKIVQRLPVRIGLDPRELPDHPLYLGLSMSVDIDVHDLSGKPLSKVPVWHSTLDTAVYTAQGAGVESEIRHIVSENLVHAPSRVARAAP